MIRSRCAVCDAASFEPVIDLGYHPLADRFLYPEDLEREETSYPLRVRLCKECGYAGLEYLVAPEARYRDHDYSYTSGNSPVSVAHFRELASSICSAAKPTGADVIVDIGSNDGTLLSAIREMSGASVIGIEPSPNIAALARQQDIDTLCGFFDAGIAEQLRSGKGRPLVAVATNVMNHANDVRAFAAAVRVLAPSAYFVFEVPYLGELLDRRAFDTIYLEHISYFGLKALRRLLAEAGMTIVKFEVIDYMGGSIRVFASAGAKEAPDVESAVAGEHRRGYDEPVSFNQFMRDVHDMKVRVCTNVYAARSRGERVVGIGAATKGNTFLNYCRLDSTTIDFVTDSSPLKIGKFLPGSHIPIRPDESLEAGYGHALILPWNITAFLKQKLGHLNLKFITRD